MDDAPLGARVPSARFLRGIPDVPFLAGFGHGFAPAGLVWVYCWTISRDFEVTTLGPLLMVQLWLGRVLGGDETRGEGFQRGRGDAA
jgi:hypothetical protein